MMTNRTLWGAAAVGAGIICVLAVLANQHTSRAVEQAESGRAVAVPAQEVGAPDSAIGERPSVGLGQVSPRPVHEPDATAFAGTAQTQPTTRAAAARPPRPAKFADVAGQEGLTPQKVARVALGFVGADPVAEQFWEAAINSPNFTPDERKDLIEDLNEEGFDDPKNLTPADLPLILSRLQLIENLAPQAADEVNAAAFAEAYKDLVIMYAKLTR